MRIRRLLPEDHRAVHAINEAGTPGVHTASLEELEKITAMSCISLVAEEEGAVVAFCQVLPAGALYRSVNYQWFSERYQDFVYLDRVAVAPGHRGEGIGAAL